MYPDPMTTRLWDPKIAGNFGPTVKLITEQFCFVEKLLESIFNVNQISDFFPSCAVFRLHGYRCCLINVRFCVYLQEIVRAEGRKEMKTQHGQLVLTIIITVHLVTL